MQQSASLLIPPRGDPAVDRPGTAEAMPSLRETALDFDLADRVERALRATGDGALHGVGVTVHAGSVRLGGRVPNSHLKQLAHAAALCVPGVHEVQNDLEIAPPD
jgi:osmotically-inducible protein OsmY